MEIIETLFFDTYAFFEILIGNENYQKYTTNVAIITTKLNLMELHYGILLKYGKERAELYYQRFAPFTVEITDEVIQMANFLKASLKERSLSYVDCIGYITAKIRGIKFLTGDRQFKDLDNVEYVP